jgi:methyl-galactoside transport system permease protein
MNPLNSAATIKTKEILSKYTSLITFVGLVFILAILTQGRALTWESMRLLILQETVRAFAALGVGMIIITRGIDLSIGFVVCLSASVAASFAQEATHAAAIYPGRSFPLYVPILAGILTGGVFGLFNGFLVAYGKLPPFIATLGTMVIARGIQLIYTNAAIVSSLTAPYRAIAQSTIGDDIRLPIMTIYLVLVVLLVWIILKHTRLGANFYAIGGNAQAARVSGINVEQNLVYVYLIAGLFYGCAGVLLSSRLALANALTAVGMELDAIAAVTVGGVSHAGGVGTVGGMVIGIFTIGLINYGMSFMAVDSFYQHIVKGVIIIGAVYFDMKKYAKRS